MLSVETADLTCVEGRDSSMGLSAAAIKMSREINANIPNDVGRTA